MGRSWGVVCLLALAGCDAVFGLYGNLPATNDARADGPPDSGLDSDGSCTIMACADSGDTHDEDSDCIPDPCDPCPHLPAATGDGDGDRVGDSCDENPGIDSIAAFTSFVSSDGFTPVTASSWTFEDDRLRGVTAPQVAYAYHVQLSRPPYRIATRVTLPPPGWVTYAGVAFLMTQASGSPTNGFIAVVNRKTNGTLELAIHAPPSFGVLGPPIQGAAPVVMDSAGPTFDLVVEVTPSSVSVSARDILSTEMKSFGASNINLSMNYYDGVVAGVQADVDFTYWFRSQTLPSNRVQR